MVLGSEWAYLSDAETTLSLANVAPIVNNMMFAGGAAELCSSSNIFWRNGPWNAGLGIYHVNETHDGGATTTEAGYEGLGRPDNIEPFFTQGRTIYRRVVDRFITYNMNVGSELDGTRNALLGGTKVRLAVINLTDKELQPAAPLPEQTRHGLVGTELGGWHIMEANQGVALDAEHFYGSGNHALVKHRKDTGELVAEWFGPRDGQIIHLNSGWVQDERLVLSHSNYPQLPMASSLETYDARTLQPLLTYSFVIQLGSLTWAVRHQGYWWPWYANYNDGSTAWLRPALELRSAVRRLLAAVAILAVPATGHCHLGRQCLFRWRLG